MYSTYGTYDQGIPFTDPTPNGVHNTKHRSLLQPNRFRIPVQPPVIGRVYPITGRLAPYPDEGDPKMTTVTVSSIESFVAAVEAAEQRLVVHPAFDRTRCRAWPSGGIGSASLQRPPRSSTVGGGDLVLAPPGTYPDRRSGCYRRHPRWPQWPRRGLCGTLMDTLNVWSSGTCSIVVVQVSRSSGAE